MSVGEAACILRVFGSRRVYVVVAAPRRRPKGLPSIVVLALTAATGVGAALITAKCGEQHCTPGKSEACKTAVGDAGTQTCASDGRSFTLCVPVRSPAVEITCPGPYIEANEAFVFGKARVGPGMQVHVFVGDEQGLQYWHQGSPLPLDSGVWVQKARFGNPYGVGHKKTLPCNYRVTALVTVATVPASPVDQKQFAALERNAQGQRSCVVVRNPEQAIRCMNMRPTITAPVPRSCPFSVGEPVDDCDVTEVTQTSNPVQFAWTSTEQWVNAELYRDGALQPTFPKSVRDPLSLQLSPGLYEFKLRYPNNDCIRSVWFRVR